MKIRTVIVTFLAGTILISTVWAGPSDTVIFNDSNLETAVESALNTQDPTEEQMLGLHNLYAAGKGISDLTGLQFAKNLSILDLNGNNVSDLSPLAELTSLTNLNLKNNGLSDSDISDLAGLTGMTRLNLSNNQISSISDLSGMTSMVFLYLSNNTISSISALSEMTNLQELSAASNQISNISILAGKTFLTKINLSGNLIADIPSLSGLNNLHELDLSNNQIAVITNLQNLTSLATLKLGWNQITSVQALSNLTNLNILFLAWNQITDIGPLSTLVNLTWLDLRGNGIIDNPDYSGDGIFSLTPLVNLVTLQLDETPVSDLSPLFNHINILHLALRATEVSDVSPLATLPNLIDVDLAGANVADISPFAVHTQLLWLRLTGNPLDNAAYCIYLPLIDANNDGLVLGVSLEYDADNAPESCTTSVVIDIKPGSYPNTINLGSNGVVPVAILSGADFDATKVDPATVKLAGATVAVRGKGDRLMASEEDIDGDGKLDLVLKMMTENFDPDAFQDGWAVLIGQTYDGQQIEGEDSIIIVPLQ